jgi:hypothetical protein
VEPPDVLGRLVGLEGFAVPIHLVEHAGQRLLLHGMRGVGERARFLRGDLAHHLGGQLVEPFGRGRVVAVETNNQCEHTPTLCASPAPRPGDKPQSRGP